MAIRKVIQIGDDVLRKKSEKVTIFDSELHLLLNDMKETLISEDGAGLAAPQIGVLKRVVVCTVEEGYFEFVNPSFVWQKGEQRGYEGCLSVKGKRGVVVRPAKVKIVYYDRYGGRHSLVARDFFAKCICHELDHLDGVLYVDKAESVVDDTDEEE